MSAAERRPTPTALRASHAAFEEHGSGILPRLPASAIPRLAMGVDGLRHVPLDASSAYLLSLVDGRSTVATIVDVCDGELSESDALARLAELIRYGAIELTTTP